MLGDFERTTSPARAAHIFQITGASDTPHELHKGCYRRATSDAAEELLPTLVALMNQTAIEEASLFASHAAVIAQGSRIIAFPADSGGGKTTLAAAAVLAGFAYISDEALVLDDDGHVVPYPKPMALSRWSCYKLGLAGDADEQLLTADDLGGKTRGEPGRLTDLVIAHYGQERTMLERRPGSEAVAALIEKSFNHYKDPQRAFRLATETARNVRVWSLEYDDPMNAVRLLTEAQN